MPLIRLLTPATEPGPVQGQAGDVVEVDARTAQEWADGQRAERVVTRTVEVERAVPREGGSSAPH